MLYACAAAAKRVRKIGLPWLRIYGGPETAELLAAGFILAKLSAEIVYYPLAYAGRSVGERYLNPRTAPAARHSAGKPSGPRAIAAFKTIAGAGRSHGLKVI
jgi:hypothetical protein